MESILLYVPEYRNGDTGFGDIFTNIIKVSETFQDDAYNFQHMS